MKRLIVILLLATACFADSPQPFLNAAVTTAVNVKAAPTGLYGFVLANPAATVCFLQIFNTAAANVTLGTTVPALSIPVNISSTTVPGITAMFFENSPVPFNVALSVAATTTATGNTACGTGMVVNILYL